MIGKPKYKVGDIVKFEVHWQLPGEETRDEIKTGVIGIVDKWGTFEQNTEVSYDIMVKEENCFYKHFTENCIIEKIGEMDPNKVFEV